MKNNVIASLGELLMTLNMQSTRRRFDSRQEQVLEGTYVYFVLGVSEVYF